MVGKTPSGGGGGGGGGVAMGGPGTGWEERTPNTSTSSMQSALAQSPTKAQMLVAQAVDFSQCAVKQRAWWHLRYLYEAVPGEDQQPSEEGITVIHKVAQVAKPRSSPFRGRRTKRRKPRGWSISSASSETPSVDYGSSPPSPSYGPQDDDTQPSGTLVLDPSTQVGRVIALEHLPSLWLFHIPMNPFWFVVSLITMMIVLSGILCV